MATFDFAGGRRSAEYTLEVGDSIVFSMGGGDYTGSNLGYQVEASKGGRPFSGTSSFMRADSAALQYFNPFQVSAKVRVFDYSNVASGIVTITEQTSVLPTAITGITHREDGVVLVNGLEPGAAGAVALAAHLADAADAHDASAISTTGFNGELNGIVEVQAALEVLDNLTGITAVVQGLADHIADAADAHAGSAIGVAGFGAILIGATEVQTALDTFDTFESNNLPIGGGAPAGILAGQTTVGGALTVVDGLTGTDIPVSGFTGSLAGLTAVQTALDVLDAAVLDAKPFDEMVFFKGDFTLGLLSPAVASTTDAAGTVVTDANAQVIIPEQGHYLQTFGSTLDAGPAYDGTIVVERDGSLDQGEQGTVQINMNSGTALQHYKLLRNTHFVGNDVPGFEIICRIASEVAVAGGITGKTFIGFRAGNAALIPLTTERVGIECDWLTASNWRLRNLNSASAEDMTGGAAVVVTDGGLNYVWFKIVGEASGPSVKLYQVTGGVWALVDTISPTSMTFTNPQDYFVVEMKDVNGVGTTPVIVLDYLSVKLFGTR